MPRIATLVVIATAATLLSACATKGYVREQVGSSETRLSQRADTAEGQLKQTTDRTAANAQAIDAAGQRLQGLDTRVGQVSSVADGAKRDAATAMNAAKEADDASKQRFANRNKYSPLEQKTIYFDFDKAVLKDQGINDLEEIARALKADPNAVVELQGFADSRGSDKYNYQLTRDRVDAVTRYLVQRHGIDLRRIHAVGMGKDTPPQGWKATRDSLNKSRRVEMRLLAPQS
jgi:outer membrane protein OmpA-like peptidoglycan-associated protein